MDELSAFSSKASLTRTIKWHGYEAIDCEGIVKQKTGGVFFSAFRLEAPANLGYTISVKTPCDELIQIVSRLSTK